MFRPLRSLLPFLGAMLLLACGSGRDARERVAQGGKRYGGVFNINESERIRSIFPLSLSQASGHRLAAQIYQGLVRFDPADLSIQPCLAERWEVDASATVYTFHLRRDVLFHDDPVFRSEDQRRFDAEDVRYCFEAICTARPDNQMFWLFQDRLLGADAFHEATEGGGTPGPLEGIEVLDDHTIRLRLVHPQPSFLHILAHQGSWIYPRELVEQYGSDLMGHAIGTGPFRLKLYAPEEAFILERDPDHWGRDEHGNQLPFLDGVRCTLAADKNSEIDHFLSGELSCVFELPVARLDLMTRTDTGTSGAFVIQAVPGLSTQFYGFNARRSPFHDPRVRQAIGRAIDKRFLVDSVLRGLAIPADHGLVAPGINGYPYHLVQGDRFSPDTARMLLQQAGHAGGAGLPPIVLQVNRGFGYVEVAEAIQEMLERHLGLAVTLSVLPTDQHFERIEMGRAQMWREGWIADFPDPVNFLGLLYGKNAAADTAQPSYMNSTRYRDVLFDSLFTTAQRTLDERQRFTFLALAERKAMEDHYLLPIYHERSVRLLQPWVRDMPINPMEYRDLGIVWFAERPRR